MPPTKYQVVSPSAGISCHAWNADKSSEYTTSSHAVSLASDLPFLGVSWVVMGHGHCRLRDASCLEYFPFPPEKNAVLFRRLLIVQLPPKFYCLLGLVSSASPRLVTCRAAFVLCPLVCLFVSRYRCYCCYCCCPRERPESTAELMLRAAVLRLSLIHI